MVLMVFLMWCCKTKIRGKILYVAVQNKGLSLMFLDEMGFPQNSGKPCCI
jgi:hypothetical protein